jgi:hypothetical protein
MERVEPRVLVWLLLGCTLCVLALVIVALGQIFRGNLLVSVVALGGSLAVIGVMQAVQYHLDWQTVRRTQRFLRPERVMEVRRDAAQGWYFHDRVTGDTLPFEAGDIVVLLPPTAFQHKEC